MGLAGLIRGTRRSHRKTEVCRYGLQTTSSVNGSLIMTLNPTFAVILAALVIGDKISWRQSLGLALSIMGVTVVTTGGSWHALTSMHFSIGDAYILFGNLCWAAYAVIGQRMVKGLSPIQVTTVTTVIGAATITTLALLLDTGVAQTSGKRRAAAPASPTYLIGLMRNAATA